MCSHKLVPYQRHFGCKFSSVGPVKQIQYKMAAVLFYCALKLCLQCQLKQKFYGRHIVFSKLCALVDFSCLNCLSSWRKTNSNGRHLDSQHVGAFWWIAAVFPLQTNTDGRHLDFQHVVWSGVLQLSCLSSWKKQQILMAAILIFSMLVRCGEFYLYFLSDGRHLDFQHVVRSGVLQSSLPGHAQPGRHRGRALPLQLPPSPLQSHGWACVKVVGRGVAKFWVETSLSCWVRRGQVLGLDEAKLLMGEAWLLIRVRRG
jgi:hypothetical protein